MKTVVAMTAFFQLALLVLLFIPATLHVWGREGHEIVALIVEQRLDRDLHEPAAMLLEGTAFRATANWAD